MKDPIVLRKLEDFGPALKQGRRERKLRQEFVAEINSMSRFTLVKAETGKSDPRLSTVIDLLKTLGLTLVAVPSHVADRVSWPEMEELPQDQPQDDDQDGWSLFGDEE